MPVLPRRALVTGSEGLPGTLGKIKHKETCMNSAFSLRYILLWDFSHTGFDSTSKHYPKKPARLRLHSFHICLCKHTKTSLLPWEAWAQLNFFHCQLWRWHHCLALDIHLQQEPTACWTEQYVPILKHSRLEHSMRDSCSLVWIFSFSKCTESQAVPKSSLMETATDGKSGLIYQNGCIPYHSFSLQTAPRTHYSGLILILLHS